MDLELEKEIEKRVAALPPLVRDAIFESNLNDKLQAIGQLHKLHVDQLSTLGDQVMLVMLGFIDQAEFQKKLPAEIRVTEEEARAITAEIDTQIFLSIQKLMQEAPPKAPPAPELHPADVMLSQKTVTVAPPPPPPPPPPAVPPVATQSTPPVAPKVEATDPSAPKPYKTDPYREPIQ